VRWGRASQATPYTPVPTSLTPLLPPFHSKDKDNQGQCKKRSCFAIQKLVNTKTHRACLLSEGKSTRGGPPPCLGNNEAMSLFRSVWSGSGGVPRRCRESAASLPFSRRCRFLPKRLHNVQDDNQVYEHNRNVAVQLRVLLHVCAAQSQGSERDQSVSMLAICGGASNEAGARGCAEIRWPSSEFPADSPTKDVIQ